MEEIVKGKIIRSREGEILKVKEVGESPIIECEDGTQIYFKEEVVKVGNSVKEVLRDGDYWNGYRLYLIGAAGEGVLAYMKPYYKEWFVLEEVKENDEIVTIEKFNSVKYKVVK